MTTRFDWNDAVRIRATAPEAYRPGAVAAVVGIDHVSNEPRAAALGVSLGSVVYVVEFADGASCELAEHWLEPVTE